jgi:hypothetical protein
MTPELLLHVQKVLVCLRAEITALNCHEGYLRLFDEFVREEEFGLAVYTLCDCLLEQPVVAISASALKNVDELRQTMQLEDPCLDELKAKLLKGPQRSF